MFGTAQKEDNVPKTALGRWAGWLLVSSVILFTLLILAYNTDVPEVLGQRTAGGLALWIVTAISVLGTLVTGAVSWLRFEDHSVVEIVVTVFAVLATTLLSFGAIPEN